MAYILMRLNIDANVRFRTIGLQPPYSDNLGIEVVLSSVYCSDRIYGNYVLSLLNRQQLLEY